LDLIFDPLFLLLGKKGYDKKLPEEKAEETKEGEQSKKAKKKAAKQSTETFLREYEEEERPGGIAHIKRTAAGMAPRNARSMYHSGRCFFDTNFLVLLVRIAVGVGIAWHCYKNLKVQKKIKKFWKQSDQMAQQIAAQQAQVIFKVPDRQGGELLISDYLDGYRWIKDNTPKDARVMAWWDYGYQITGIAERTSIADGNTWNHEHIATLGRTLTSPQKRGWNTIRHLADYVLVWAGGGGDDLAKSPHLARIGNSVFPDHCGDDDPKCNKFSFYQDGAPTPMMAKSILYNFVNDGAKGAKADKRLWQEVHKTKYGLMRVYKVLNISQESRTWIADPKNRICDAPGSWYCVGQYPPAIEKLIAKRRNFAQVEDFNKKDRKKSAYEQLIDKELAGDEL